MTKQIIRIDQLGSSFKEFILVKTQKKRIYEIKKTVKISQGSIQRSNTHTTEFPEYSRANEETIF